MHVSIAHTTRYTYAASPTTALQQVRLTPRNRRGQTVRSWSVEIEGAKVEAEFEDHNNNKVTLLGFEPGSMGCTITCTGEIETEDHAGIYGEHAGFAPLWYYLRSTPLTEPGPAVRAIIGGLERMPGQDVALLHALMSRVGEAVAYTRGATYATTTAEQAVLSGVGVCQDQAHAFIACARLLGLPARYVSGYLVMGDRVEQEASHAWAEAHVDGLGWVGFDVANDQCPDDRYVRLATGLDYAEAAPVRGLISDAPGESLTVHLQVQQQSS